MLIFKKKNIITNLASTFHQIRNIYYINLLDVFTPPHCFPPTPPTGLGYKHAPPSGRI